MISRMRTAGVTDGTRLWLLADNRLVKEGRLSATDTEIERSEIEVFRRLWKDSNAHGGCDYLWRL